MSRRSLAALWHTSTFLITASSIAVQLAMVIEGHGVLVVAENLVAPLPERVLRFFSYFTVQSNLLAAVTALSLIANPTRDGRTWRVLRVAALVGMSVTFIVYIVALRPILHLTGVAKLTDIGFHYVAPVMTVAGWMLFGPWPRIDTESLVRHLAWPVSYLIYILVLGAVTGWYPYPFIYVSQIGYPRALLNALIVTVLLLMVGAVYRIIDARLGNAKAEPLTRADGSDIAKAATSST
jgi:hypothetical protein